MMSTDLRVILAISVVTDIKALFNKSVKKLEYKGKGGRVDGFLNNDKKNFTTRSNNNE